MKIPATSPFAALLGLPPGIRKKVKAAARRKQFKATTRPKTRRRESKSVAAPVRKMCHVARAGSGRSTSSSSAKVAGRDFRSERRVSARAHHHAAPAVADVPVPRQKPPQRRDGLSPAARRIIALGAEARGENIEPDGIEAQLNRERDAACGITIKAREIIDRAAAKTRIASGARAAAGASRG